jgi:hypothetical protein
MSVAGLMNKQKYGGNIYRLGDLMTNAPFTVLNSENGTVVQLPLPINLNSSMNADWQQENVSIPRFQLMHNKEAINNTDIPKSFKDFWQLTKGVANSVVSAGKNFMSDDIQAIRARTKSRSKLGGLKTALNPRMEMLFNGMQFKSYTFDFSLVPKSKKDSNDIQKAIEEIQRASVPSLLGEKMFMQYPETWFIKFMAGEGDGNKYLMKINECCCTGVTVNYTPHGESYNIHEENAPIAIELTLDFTEIFIPTKETIDEGFSG